MIEKKKSIIRECILFFGSCGLSAVIFTCWALKSKVSHGPVLAWVDRTCCCCCSKWTMSSLMPKTTSIFWVECVRLSNKSSSGLSLGVTTSQTHAQSYSAKMMAAKSNVHVILSICHVFIMSRSCRCHGSNRKETTRGGHEAAAAAGMKWREDEWESWKWVTGSKWKQMEKSCLVWINMD